MNRLASVTVLLAIAAAATFAAPIDEFLKEIDTIIVGEAYHTDIEEICSCLRRAAERKEVLSVTSHDIAPDAKHIHMKTEWLEKILSTASECGLAVIGFNELPHVS